MRCRTANFRGDLELDVRDRLGAGHTAYTDNSSYENQLSSPFAEKDAVKALGARR